MLDRLAAVRVNGDHVTAPRELTGATDDARFGAAEWPRLDVTAVVVGRDIGKDDARHGGAAAPRSKAMVVR